MNKRRMEFSKRLFIIVSVLNIIIVIFSFIMIWKVGDLSPLSYLIPSSFGELATATGFYYSKAKKENEIKIKNSQRETDMDFIKKYGLTAYKETKEDFSDGYDAGT